MTDPLRGLLQGYYYDVRNHNYIRAETGRFVARAHIVELMERSVREREERMVRGVEALAEGRISPNVFVARSQTMLKRQYLQERALARGGWDRLTEKDLTEVAQRLTPEFERLIKLAGELQEGKASMAQGQNRMHMYLGHARAEFLQVEREEQAVLPYGLVRIERRVLEPAEHCEDCLEYYERGWQPEGQLPLPTQDSRCDGNCRCRLERRVVSSEEAEELMGTKA